MPLKNFFKRIFSWIAKVFTGLKKELQDAVHIGVIVTDAIKTFDETHPGLVDIITAVIPGEIDDTIKNRIREKLPMIMVQLRLVDETRGLTDPQEIVAAALKVINQLEGDYKSAFLHNLSIIIAQVAADGKLDWKDAVFLLEWYYREKHKQ